MNLKSGWFFLIAVVLLGVGLAMRAQYSSSYNSQQATDIERRLAARLSEIDREALEFQGVSDSSRLWATWRTVAFPMRPWICEAQLVRRQQGDDPLLWRPNEIGKRARLDRNRKRVRSLVNRIGAVVGN